MQPELCNEKNDKTDRIPFIVHKRPKFCPPNTDFDTGHVVKTILLSQEPQESIDLDFSLKYSSFYDHSFKSNAFNFQWNWTLTFENNLHDVSNDYGYEIDFYLHVHNRDTSSHTILHSQREIRKTNRISLSETKTYASNREYPEFFKQFLMKANRQHICCNIRRYNSKKVQDVDQQSIQNINIGAILFEKGLYSDALLTVGEETFHVHKDILSSASNVFGAMFSHDMVESKESQILIEDFDPKIVKGLLSFIYTGKTLLLSKMPFELFQIAHKYGIHSLEAQCKEYFLFGVNKENIVSMLDTANTYELTDLKANLMKFIKNHETNMVLDKGFQQFLFRDLKIDSIVYILKLCDKYNYLFKDLEIKAFEVVKKNNEVLAKDNEFLKLFETHALLMKRFYVFTHKKD